MIRENWDRMAIILEIIDDEGIEQEISIRATTEVCPRCNGRGKHDHEAFSNGITSDEWAEWGDEDRESYMAGAYDVRCSVCDGRNVVLRADETDANWPQLQKWYQEEAAYRRECEAERRMGA